MKPSLFWIPGSWRGRLAITTRPRGGDWLADEARAWRAAGLNVVISLLERREADQLDLGDERRFAESAGIEFISAPIVDRGIPESTREALELLHRIAGLLESGRNVAIHCRQGVGRSGLIAASVLVLSGVSADDAIRQISQARGVVIPDTAEQREWIERLPVSGVLDPA